MMAVDVDGSGSSFEAGEPRRLFSVLAVSENMPYDVTADGQQFIINCRGQGTGMNSINVIVNWNEEFKEQ